MVIFRLEFGEHAEHVQEALAGRDASHGHILISGRPEKAGRVERVEIAGITFFEAAPQPAAPRKDQSL